MSLISEKNAMNAAEITDKLGLHSLRQRAWVSLSSLGSWNIANHNSTSNPLARLPVMDSTKVWSGSQALSERPDTSKCGAFSLTPRSFCELPQNNRNRFLSQTSPPHRSLVLLVNFLVCSAVLFHERRNGGHCKMSPNQVLALF